MLYAISATDAPDSLALRRQHRDEHRARLRLLQEAGCLVFAGPYPAVDSSDPGEAGFAGSLIIAQFDDLEAATAWAQADVYQRCGVYSCVDVKPLIQVLP